MKLETMPGIPTPHADKRKVFILPLWARGKDEPVWIGEVQDVQTGETVHVQGLEALFDLLKQKTNQAVEPKQEIVPAIHIDQKKGKKL
jgi:hypothetical protein